MSEGLKPDGISADPAELRERYQRLVELAPDGIVIHRDGTVTLANAAAVRLLGAKGPAEVVGRPIADFLNPPYLKELHDQIVAAETSAAPPSAEPAPAPAGVRDRLRRFDGATVEVEVIAIPFVDRGQPAAHLVVRDITQRLEIEERIQRVQQMEAVGAVAGGVAHEINNMMTIVLGLSEMLSRDGDLRPGIAADVREIRKAAGHAATVTRQLLAFSRRATRDPQTLQIDSLVADSLPVLRNLLGENRILVSTPDCACRVRVDAVHFGQVLINLVLNARDAMPAGGTFTIATAEREMSGRPSGGRLGRVRPGPYAVITVSDTGLGMDAATARRIFEPFFTTKPVGQGTGLGLAAVEGIMEQSGGCVAVESAPGHGSTFTLYLPVVPAETAFDAPADSSGRETTPLTARPGATVLIVEDEAGVREVAARILRAEGYRALQAADGAAALRSVERLGAPDLVLTDLLMPGMAGDELARQLTARWPQLPVLFMSGHSDDALLQSVSLAQGAPVVKKPFSPEGLVQAVQEMLAAATHRGATQPSQML